jgi:hypothetical protein
MTRKSLNRRVTQAAEAALAEQQYVSTTDVLVGLGWLTPSQIDRWRQGRIESLESVAQVEPSKIAAALEAFERWAQDRRLNPSDTEYLARTRDRRQLRFSVSGDPAIESAYRTHWVSPDLSQPTIERQSRPPDLVVISPIKEWTCTSCGGTGNFLFMEDPGPLCLDCADLGHLDFLPSGDAAMTRRAKRASRLSAIVVRWSRSRKRYERQGILAEPEVTRRRAPAGGSATEFAVRTRTRASRPTSLPRSPRSSRTAPPAGPRRSRVTRQRGAAAGSDEAQPGGRSIRTRCCSQSRRRSDM